VTGAPGAGPSSNAAGVDPDAFTAVYREHVREGSVL
jgi:hypothetical protein